MLVYTGWINFEAIVIEKTLKEKSTIKKYYSNNYN